MLAGLDVLLLVCAGEALEPRRWSVRYVVIAPIAIRVQKAAITALLEFRWYEWCRDLKLQGGEDTESGVRFAVIRNANRKK